MSDTGAMLFNLTKHTSFPCLLKERAITCYKYRGPRFGYGELSVYHEPFNKENACKSFANNDVYRIPKNDEGINMLTN